MNQLIPTFTGVLAGETQQLVNARDLHAVLESGQDFSNWIKNRIETYGFIEGEEFSIAVSKTSNFFGGRPKTEYHLCVDMAKELALLEVNGKGQQARRYFIQMEKVARQEIPAFLRRGDLPRPGQVEALQTARLKTIALQKPRWAQLKRYYESRLTQGEMAKLTGISERRVRDNLRDMAACGLVDYRTNPSLSAAGRKGLAVIQARQAANGGAA